MDTATLHDWAIIFSHNLLQDTSKAHIVVYTARGSLHEHVVLLDSRAVCDKEVALLDLLSSLQQQVELHFNLVP